MSGGLKLGFVMHLVNIYFTIFDVGSTCYRYINDTEKYFDAGSGSCYVIFPQRNKRAVQNWFAARNKCLMEGGDLADAGADSLPLKSGTYLVGLRRDPFVWLGSGKSCC